VAEQVPVELRRVSYNAINHSACGTVPTPICVVRVLREKPDVVAFGHNNHRDFRVDFQFLTSLWERNLLGAPAVKQIKIPCKASSSVMNYQK